jgi:hypothetical protein
MQTGSVSSVAEVPGKPARAALHIFAKLAMLIGMSLILPLDANRGPRTPPEIE